MLEVRLIGKFDIQCDGKPVIIPSRAAQSLFAYLILTAGTLHRREKLAGMLWPDESEQKARTYLRNELWRIRKTLSHTSTVEYLLADNVTIGFDHSSVYWLDAAALKNVTDNTSTDQLISILAHSLGELLPGFYEDWVVLEREHFQVIFEEKIACLLEMLEREQRWNDILDWAERWISLAHAPEAAYQALMLAYDALGDHTQVISTYERCKRVLQELDLEPSEKTRTLVYKQSSRIKVPIPLTSFIGREKEIKEVTELFLKSRLITLTGTGGVGKTRLAIQVVAEVLVLFSDGVWFLDLAPLSDPALVSNTLASLLGLRELGEVAVTELLINYFRSRTALIIFDNCEHLIESCAQLIHLLLISCENLTILATSRESLRISGELPYRVPSLEIPRADLELPIDELSEMEAVKLFTERAAVNSPKFAANEKNVVAIGQICERLDGIPLAIELAAARISMLSPQQILMRLDDRFNLLRHGLRSALPRHQTLRAMIEWSYDLLSEEQQILFRRLAVFVGGWSLEAAEQVCAAPNDISNINIFDILTYLVEKSLVILDKARYHMLETTRRYAYENLILSSEFERVQDRHLDFFMKLAEEAEPELYGMRQLMWLEKLEMEQGNIRAALEWGLRNEVESGLRLASALWPFWFMHAHFIEGRQWYDQALSLAKEESAPIKIRLLIGAASNAFGRGNLEQIIVLSDQCLMLSLEQENKWGITMSLHHLGVAALFQGNHKKARGLLEEGLAIARDAQIWIVIDVLLGDLGDVAYAEGNYEQASALYEEELALLPKHENRWASCYALGSLVSIAYRQSDYVRAQTLAEQALRSAREFGDRRLISYLLGKIGMAVLGQGKIERAVRLISAANAIIESLGTILDADESADYDNAMTIIHAHLSEVVSETLQDEGRCMTMEQAIRYALEKETR